LSTPSSGSDRKSNEKHQEPLFISSGNAKQHSQLEDGLAVSYNTKHTFPSNYTHGLLTKEPENFYTQKPEQRCLKQLNSCLLKFGSNQDIIQLGEWINQV
jgi:hypothetical protein